MTTAAGLLKFEAINAHKRWGNTCPCLNIAKAMGLDYAVPLHIVDEMLHGRRAPDWVLDALGNDMAKINAVMSACRSIVEMTRYQRTGGKL